MSQHLQSTANSTRLKEMHFRRSNLSSPAETPRLKSLSSPSNIAAADVSDAVRNQKAASSPNGLHPRSPNMAEATDDIALSASESDARKSLAQPAKSPSQVASERYARILAGMSIPSPVLTPVVAKDDSIFPSSRSEVSVVKSPKSAAASEAAEKAARMAQEMKNVIGAQMKHSRLQAVQSAAAVQTAAEAEYKKTTRVLESAYTHKVEEAAVLRRECAKLQETVEALKLGMTKSASDLQNELGHARHESLDQAQVLEVDVQVNIDIFMSANDVHRIFSSSATSLIRLRSQAKSEDIAERGTAQMPLPAQSLEGFVAITDQFSCFEA